ncbi:MAG: DUF3825 domain-containing protein [Deltaproteobacteria bacterium]|jgi:hypothetical protein|nr:DUF3825 domain-containing protein [Deltaproteobacteria bacterium]
MDTADMAFFAGVPSPETPLEQNPHEALPPALSDFAYLHAVDAKLEHFAGLPLASGPAPADGGRLPAPGERGAVLKEYLSFAYQRAREEGKIAFAGGCAAFDTGLADRFAEPVYAVFVRNKCGGRQAWFFLDLAAPSEGQAGKILVNQLWPLPARPVFSATPADFRYDPKSGVPACSLGHIIMERPERLPPAFLARHLPPETVRRNPPLTSQDGLEEYRAALAQALSSDPKAAAAMAAEFKTALREAAFRQKDPFWAAVPFWHPATRKIQLLMPLELAEREPSGIVALVADKGQSGAYVGRTVLPLGMARRNFRGLPLKKDNWLWKFGFAQSAPRLKRGLAPSFEEGADCPRPFPAPLSFAPFTRDGRALAALSPAERHASPCPPEGEAYARPCPQPCSFPTVSLVATSQKKPFAPAVAGLAVHLRHLAMRALGISGA